MPQSGDDVLIPNLGDPNLNGDVSIFLNGSATINSLISAESLTITAGEFSVAAASTIDGGLNLAGGELWGDGSVELGGNSTWSAGNLRLGGKLTIAV